MTQTHPPEPAPPPGRAALLVAAGVVAAVALLAVSFVAGLLVGSRTMAAGSDPGDDSVDAGFARDMQAHHRQAVQMSTYVLDGTDDAEMVTLARDIQLTQQQQAGQMYGWLASWGLAQGSAQPVMAWMSADMAGTASPADMAGMHDEHTRMPGLATQAQLERLQAASGTTADRLYLQLMLPHHEGGVVMAEVAAQRAGDPAVRRLARAVVVSQTAEMTVLRAMLDARGGAVADG